MKKIITTAAVLLWSGAASAATLDFVAEADGANGERGIANGNSITMDGIDVTFQAEMISAVGQAGYNPVAYFDRGNAGLGVCKTIDTTPTASLGDNECASGAGDDNVTYDELVTLSFGGGSTYAVANILMREEGHKPFGTTDGSLDKTLLFGYNGGALTQYTFGGLMASFFNSVTSVTFAFDNANDGGTAEQFYLGSMVITPDGSLSEVPLPAGLPLLLAGLAGLGVAGRRSRKTTNV